MKKIFTIGYSAFEIKDFIKILNKYNITCVIDVRTNPFSSYYLDYNRNNLQKTLNEYNILYRNYSYEFGARQDDEKFYSGDGILNFAIFLKSNQFSEGLYKIDEGIKLGYNFVLMCSEKDPINCHRSIMLGQGFKNNGYLVQHILNTGEIESQDELENRMLNMYFNNNYQLSIFTPSIDRKKMIEECYKKRNKEIGFSEDDL